MIAKATKYLIILSPLLLLPLLLQLTTTAPRNYISGSLISLSKELSNNAVQKSGISNDFRKVKKERLDELWICILTLPQGTKIWRNYTDYFILRNEISSDGTQVFQGNASVPGRKITFDIDTPAGVWDSYDNQVFLTTRGDEDPNRSLYYIDYSTFATTDPEAIQQEVLQNPLPYFDGVAYPLNSPLWTGVHNKVRVYRNGKQENSWKVLDDFQLNLHDAGVLRITTDQPEYSLTKQLRPGIASLTIHAKADFKEQKMPAILVFQNNKLIDRIAIQSDGYEEYSTRVFVVPEGRCEIKLALEEIVKNRNASILDLNLHYSSAIVLKEKVLGAYTADYSSKCPFLWWANFYHKFSNRGAEKFVSEVNHGREVRRALVFAPNTKVTYPLKIPQQASFRFGYAFETPAGCGKSGTGANFRLAMSVKEPFQKSRVIFSTNLKTSGSSANNLWNDELIHLSQLSGKPVDLTIETIANEENGAPLPLTYISDPVIQTESYASNFPEQIIVISADALRADHLGVYGYERSTSPNLDAFAKDSVLFENAVSSASWTLPSFSSLFTSMHPSFHRAYSFDVRPLTSELSLIPEIQARGFATAAFVNNPCLYPMQGFSEGFDRYDYGIKNEQERIEQALQWIERMKNQRFFLMLHLMKPHEPYAAPSPYASAFIPESPRRVDTSTRGLDEIDSFCKPMPQENLQYVIAQYDSEVLYMDQLLSHLFRRLQELNLYDNSMIVFLSDHGEEFREHQRLLHGTSVYQEQVHVPLIIKFPANYSRRNIRVQHYVETINVLPTILDVIRADLPKSIQGKSLLPLIGRTLASADLLISETQIAGKTAMIQGHYKYIFTSNQKDFEASAVPCSIRKSEELYDLQSDPREMKDILAERPEIVEQFRKERLLYENKVAEFLKKKEADIAKTPYVLDESVKEELRALGYLN